MIGGLVLAAGAGRRFGGPKQLALLDGRPLLEHAVSAMIAVPALERVVVVLGGHGGEVRAAVRFGRAEPVLCERWAQGQAASLRCGLRALGDDVDAVVIALGDQPRIAPEAIERVLAAGLEGPEPATRASYGAKPGHPVLLRRELLGAARTLTGDMGARELLAGVAVRLVDMDGVGRGDDVDTPEELEMLRT